MTRPLADSGQRWLGALPEDWRLVPLGRVFRERKTTVSDEDYEPLSVSMAGIVPRMENVALTASGENRKLVRDGDYVINSRSDRKGSGGLSSSDGSVSVISTVLRPVGIEPRFAHHLLRSTAFQEEFYRWGSGIVADLWSTRYDKMSKITLPLPPTHEQRTIADYLDRETAKIDALIEKQTKLIDRLRERRTSLIERAVTAGIGSSVNRGHRVAVGGGVMSDWPAVPLHYLVRFGNGEDYKDVEDLEGDVPVIGSGGPFTTASDYLYDGESVLFGRKGTIDKPRHQTGRFWTVDTMFYTVLGPRVDGRWLYYWATTVPYKLYSTSTALPSMTSAVLGRLRVSLPPLPEQRAVAEYLDRETAKIDALINKAERFIDLARERRSALITAAVTGQIDVTEGAA